MEKARTHRIARRDVRALALTAALVAALAALVTAGHAATGRGHAQVEVGRTPLGRILVDSRGRTLYMFAADRHGKSACYGKCATFWPPLLASGTRVTGAGVKASLLGTTMRTDGRRQVTFDRHPLYRFVKDTKPGQANGQGLNFFGGLWWVLSPSGAAIEHTASTPPATTTSTTPSGGGGGYGP